MHTLPSSQALTPKPLQVPELHESVSVHGSPSSQAALLKALTHPDAGAQLSIVHGFLSSHGGEALPEHWPPAHESSTVHALPSSQAKELAAFTQPTTVTQLSSVQTLPSSQGLDPTPLQAPAVHESASVHGLPSSHAALLAAVVHPEIGAQLSVVQGFLSSHGGPAAPRHWPLAQVSLTVQAFPSSHAAAFAAWTHPTAWRQLSSVHTLPSSQTMNPTPAHVPPLHKSTSVHGSPSSHPRPSAASTCTQPLEPLQVSMVQGLPSSQLLLAPGKQAPAAQWSPVVQRSPSVHVLATAAFLHPLPTSQESIVHTLPSSQLNAVAPGEQTPARHRSPTVQGSLSASHEVPSATLLKPQAPVLGSHWLFPHCKSPLLLSHTTIWPGFTSHMVNPPAAATHTGTPSHRSPLSGQGSAAAESQQTLGPGTHVPPLHASPWVQGTPSSHLPSIGL